MREDNQEYIIAAAFQATILPYKHEPSLTELAHNPKLLPDNYNNKYMAIFTGPRHSDIFQYMYELNIIYEYKTSTQGFITNQYRFVNRQEAYKIALAAGQIKTNVSISENDIKNGRQLYSEDLW